jgi:hypothetical protein
MASLHQALLDEVSLISFLEIFFPFYISFLANCASIDRRGAICRSCPPQASQAKLILMMCAVASVYAPEASYTFGKPPRVAVLCGCAQRASGAHSWGSTKARQCAKNCGVFDRNVKFCCLVLNASLVKLQALYYFMIGAPRSSWVVLGTGIRKAQDVGAHHASFAEGRRPLEAEMWKRVFWQVYGTINQPSLTQPR